MKMSHVKSSGRYIIHVLDNVFGLFAESIWQIVPIFSTSIFCLMKQVCMARRTLFRHICLGFYKLPSQNRPAFLYHITLLPLSRCQSPYLGRASRVFRSPTLCLTRRQISFLMLFVSSLITAGLFCLFTRTTPWRGNGSIDVTTIWRIGSGWVTLNIRKVVWSGDAPSLRLGVFFLITLRY